jgi:hypothetical protein
MENPAELFISKPADGSPGEAVEGQREQAAPPPEGFRPNYLYIETRSKRLQLLLQPSLLEKIRKRADREQRSVNDLVHTILEDALRGE